MMRWPCTGCSRPSSEPRPDDPHERVVGEVTPSRQGPDRLALARIARAREAAAAKFLRDRDTDALEAAMARLDEEEREAKEEKVEDGVPADVAVRYVKNLDGTWAAADGGQGRKMLAEALFERIDVRGFRETRLHLTDAAIAHGFGAVLPERLAISVSGRGERGSASLTHLRFRPRFVLENVTLEARTWPAAYRKAG
jgi:hypothetical protein